MAIHDVRDLAATRRAIDLSGPVGSVFFLMAQVESLAKETGKPERAAEILEDMQSGNYDHAVKVFDREFGDVVDLYR